MGRRDLDPLGRDLVLAIAAGRIAIGVGALFLTRPALRVLGFAETDAAGRSMARLAGGRDIAIGALAFAARDDRRALEVVSLSAAAVDAVDAVSLGLGARDAQTRRAGIGGAVSGSSAAVAGIWAWRRLRGS